MNAVEQGKSVGQPLNRYEAPEKITGKAKYAADYRFPNLAYGVLVASTITRGSIVAINSQPAEKCPGVICVMSHLNAPAVPGRDENPMSKIPIFAGREFKPFLNDEVFFNCQPAALVIADTLELAQHAASLVEVQYEQTEHQTNLNEELANAVRPEKPGDYSRGESAAIERAPVKITAVYETPFQVHNPMEPHATTAWWEGDDQLYIYNKSQSVSTTRKQFAAYFNLKEENVKVYAPFVGGAFGSASRMWAQEMAAVMAAKKIGRPVQVALARHQVFNMVGYRPQSQQQITAGAEKDGILVGIRHAVYGTTSRYEQFMERILDPTKSLYNFKHLEALYKLVPLDMSTPCPARGPGETSGSFALESAMDELAYVLKMDPLQFRLKNLPSVDPSNDKPWSSNFLIRCCEIGAENFGWNKRVSKPRSMTRNGLLTGMGMSIGIYKAERVPASASVSIFADGTALIRCSVADTGPGSVTILTQIAADGLGLPVHQVKIEWADADLPEAPPQYGSHTTASTGSAVHDACILLNQKIAALQPDVASESTPNYPAILQQNNLPALTATAKSTPGADAENFSSKSFGAHFVEVSVHPLTGQVRVTRVVSAIDAGRIINPKTGRSQVLGAVTWGIGIALMEQGVVDHRSGRYVNNNLANYHVPVNADIPLIDVHFIDEPDGLIDPMGAKGLGEIGLIGFTAAVANAVFHATGKRIRQLPITPDKLI